MDKQDDSNNTYTAITLVSELTGSILDIGGGGEGIIGRLYLNQVTAIDNNIKELEEAPSGFAKLVMDATLLEFEEHAYHHVTFFYTLMYMTTEEQERAIQEAARVCKKEGLIHIWDCQIGSAYPDPFVVQLTINLPHETINTTYGIIKAGQQSIDSITAMCEQAGLAMVSARMNNGSFKLVYRKH